MPVAWSAPRTRKRRVFPMRYSIRNGTARLGTAAVVVGLSLLACDRPRLFEPGRTEAAHYAAARIVGSYAGTAVATVANWARTSSVTCPGVLAIATQAGQNFSGSFSIPSAPGCDPPQGTIAWTVEDAGTLSFTADTPGGGVHAWGEGAQREHCTPASGS